MNGRPTGFAFAQHRRTRWPSRPPTRSTSTTPRSRGASGGPPRAVGPLSRFGGPITIAGLAVAIVALIYAIVASGIML